MIHAEYDHAPDESGIVTICGTPGESDNDYVTCARCIAILRARGMLHLVTAITGRFEDVDEFLDYLNQLVPQRQVEDVPLKPGLL